MDTRSPSVLCIACLIASLASLTRAANTPQSGPTTRKVPHIVFVVGDHEYRSEATLPLVAKELTDHYGFRTTVLQSVNEKGEPDANSENNIPGLEALKDADLVVFYLRWRQLPKQQTDLIRQYLDSGRPVMGFRTSTHAFNYPKGHELERWNAFGEFALGGPPGWNAPVGGDTADGPVTHTHYGHQSSTDVTVNPPAAEHPILAGVARQFHVRSWLYHVRPGYPPQGATLLLNGKAVDANKKAADNPVAWTWTNAAGARVFTTTLGHPEDFQVEAFHRVVINAVHWLTESPIPKEVPFDPAPFKGLDAGTRKPGTQPTTRPTTTTQPAARVAE